jgi:hypothetical protein
LTIGRTLANLKAPGPPTDLNDQAGTRPPPSNCRVSPGQPTAGRTTPTASHGQGRLADRPPPSNSERPLRGGYSEGPNRNDELEEAETQVARAWRVSRRIFVPPARPGISRGGPAGPPEPGTGPSAGTTRSRTHSPSARPMPDAPQQRKTPSTPLDTQPCHRPGRGHPTPGPSRHPLRPCPPRAAARSP